MRDLRDGGDVDEIERRIGRRLEEERLGVGAHGALPRPAMSRPSISVEAMPKRGTEVLHHVAAGAEQRARRHDVIAGLEEAQQRGGDRRHAGGRGARGLRAFQQPHALLEHGDRRIGVAAVDEAGLALEALLGLLGRLVDVALGEEQRLGGLAELRAQRAPVHEQGLRASALRALRSVAGLSSCALSSPGCNARQQKTGSNSAPLGRCRALVSSVGSRTAF